MSRSMAWVRAEMFAMAMKNEFDKFFKRFKRTSDEIQIDFLNSLSSEGLSALHYAVYHKNSDAVIKLLDWYNADVLKENSKGQTPLQYSRQLYSTERVRELIEYLRNKEIEAEARAVASSDPEAEARVAASSDLEAEVKLRIQHQILDFAKKGDFDNFFEILEAYEPDKLHQAEIINSPPEGRWSALHQAAVYHQNLDVVKRLVEVYGANVSIKNSDGKTPREALQDELEQVGIIQRKLEVAEQAIQGMKQGEEERIAKYRKRYEHLTLEEIEAEITSVTASLNSVLGHETFGEYRQANDDRAKLSALHSLKKEKGWGPWLPWGQGGGSLKKQKKKYKRTKRTKKQKKKYKRTKRTKKTKRTNRKNNKRNNK